STVAPMSIATNKSETVLFVSTPNVHPRGGWTQHLYQQDMPAVAAKLYAGEIFSVSPLLGVALAAGTLGGRFNLASAGKPGMPLINPAGNISELRYAMATGFDHSGSLGVVMLKK